MSENTAALLADLSSGDEARLEAAVARITGLSIEDARALYPELQKTLAAPNADRRWWAARALAALPGQSVTPELLQALADPEPAVRQCAALGLRLRTDPQAIPALIAALSDPDALTAQLAGDALAAAGAEAVPALLAAFQPENPAGANAAARIGAVRALAAIGDHRSIPALFAALDDPSQIIVHWAEVGLERMGVGMSFFKPD
jgi:HEAT repeat protein